mmetsp:Transcript_20959/g.64092  ORF Transcript_20959/g.64092 Transcript_20959/m.64092 type:complete len:86 (-) Transcript_20959:1175-1432(-)
MWRELQWFISIGKKSRQLTKPLRIGVVQQVRFKLATAITRYKDWRAKGRARAASAAPFNGGPKFLCQLHPKRREQLRRWRLRIEL